MSGTSIDQLLVDLACKGRDVQWAVDWLTAVRMLSVTPYDEVWR